MSRRNIGSEFDRFLEEEGLLEETTATAVKRVIAYQLAEKMAKDKLTKAEMARRMDTSRSSLDRLLSAVQALGGRLKIEIDFHENAA
jgi:hypothetical protein